MKFIIEFIGHDGKKRRTIPYDDEVSAKFGALHIAVVMGLHFMGHDSDPQVLTVPEDSDLISKEKEMEG